MSASRTATTTLAAVAAASAIFALDMGLRQAFGLLLEPVTAARSLDAASFGLAVAMQNVLWGIFAPFAGAVADRCGSYRVVVFGGSLYAAGLLVAAGATTQSGFVAGAGLLVGLGMSACCFPLIMAVVSRRVPPSKRTMALGATMAGASLGQFVFPFVMQEMLARLALGDALVGLAAIMLAIVPLGAVLCRGDEVDTGERGGDVSLAAALRAAGRDRSYLCLAGGFFVCGFHVAIVATHLPAHLSNEGLAGLVGASALSIIGLFNMAGSLSFGALAMRYSRVRLLMVIYGMRALAFLGLLWAPVTPVTALVFAAAIGFVWNATVPLTSAVTSDLFGPRYLATLFGIVTASHQLGSGAGAWLGGWVFETTGGYGWAWVLAAMLALASAALHAPIRERGGDGAAPRARTSAG